MTTLLNGNEGMEKVIDGISKTPATIGSSVSIKGEITGEEDVIIHGSVEGTINLKKNVVMIAKAGRVQAHIYGQVIHVEGEVVGDLFGTDQIVIHRSGHVKGNVSAPRISIEDGARLKGSIDTDVKPETNIIVKDSEITKSSKTDEMIMGDSVTATSNGKKSNMMPARS